MGGDFQGGLGLVEFLWSDLEASSRIDVILWSDSRVSSGIGRILWLDLEIGGILFLGPGLELGVKSGSGSSFLDPFTLHWVYDQTSMNKGNFF